MNRPAGDGWGGSVGSAGRTDWGGGRRLSLDLAIQHLRRSCVLAPATLQRQGLLAPAAVGPLLDQHCSGREDLSRQIWGLMALTLWFDRYADPH